MTFTSRPCNLMRVYCALFEIHPVVYACCGTPAPPLCNLRVLGFLNLLNLCFILSLVSFFFIDSDLLSYLLLSELLWIVLYCICVFSGLSIDSFYLLGISIAILVFSGLEFSVGLLIYFFF